MSPRTTVLIHCQLHGPAPHARAGRAWVCVQCETEIDAGEIEWLNAQEQLMTGPSIPDEDPLQTDPRWWDDSEGSGRGRTGEVTQ